MSQVNINSLINIKKKAANLVAFFYCKRKNRQICILGLIDNESLAGLVNIAKKPILNLIIIVFIIGHSYMKVV
ncbi:hypothetical protein AS888_17025 [Peribacillus simplex]|uniref:Uncharacterized protein n=1 Tax=Peribacillus simplex TaxID=1478 RepID=A0A109N0L5_9BACI|nr:hypothetical protein AS888_17025 [Peribacillus simplex]